MALRALLRRHDESLDAAAVEPRTVQPFVAEELFKGLQQLSKLRQWARRAKDNATNKTTNGIGISEVAATKGIGISEVPLGFPTRLRLNKWDLLRSSRARIQLSESTVDAAYERSYLLEGDDSMMTELSIKLRQQLRSQPDVVRMLERYWRLYAKKRDGGVGRDEYVKVHVRMQRALVGGDDFVQSEAVRLAEADFIVDTGTKAESDAPATIEKPLLLDSLFEIADIWTENIDHVEYVAFLSTLFDCITTVTHGVCGWALISKIRKMHRGSTVQLPLPPAPPGVSVAETPGAHATWSPLPMLHDATLRPKDGISEAGPRPWTPDDTNSDHPASQIPMSLARTSHISNIAGRRDRHSNGGHRGGLSPREAPLTDDVVYNPTSSFSPSFSPSLPSLESPVSEFYAGAPRRAAEMPPQRTVRPMRESAVEIRGYREVVVARGGAVLTIRSVNGSISSDTAQSSLRGVHSSPSATSEPGPESEMRIGTGLGVLRPLMFGRQPNPTFSQHRHGASTFSAEKRGIGSAPEASIFTDNSADRIITLEELRKNGAVGLRILGDNAPDPVEKSLTRDVASAHLAEVRTAASSLRSGRGHGLLQPFEGDGSQPSFFSSSDSGVRDISPPASPPRSVRQEVSYSRNLEGSALLASAAEASTGMMSGVFAVEIKGRRFERRVNARSPYAEDVALGKQLLATASANTQPRRRGRGESLRRGQQALRGSKARRGIGTETRAQRYTRYTI